MNRRGFFGSLLGCLSIPFVWGRKNKTVRLRYRGVLVQKGKMNKNGDIYGGHLVPFEFEDVIINTPVLEGELYPLFYEKEYLGRIT